MEDKKNEAQSLAKHTQQMTGELKSWGVSELKQCRSLRCDLRTVDSYNIDHALDVNSRCQTRPLSAAPHSGTPPASPSYQRLLVLIGFDAADKVGLAVGQDSHQLIQGLLELACEGEWALGGV